MKELTIEQKAQRYDIAVELADKFKKEYLNYKELNVHKGVIEAFNNIFSGLKESEDEKTKRLLHTIANKMSQHLRDIFTEEEFQCFDAWSNAWLEKQGEQKSWSEEDEKYLKLAIDNFQTLGNSFLTTWLKSLKDRVQLQNITYYNPYKEVVESIAEMCKHYDTASHSGLRDFYDNVKVKCKEAKEFDTMFPQSTWKPSEEQMKALWDSIPHDVIEISEREILLDSLYQDLKKLR